MNEQIKELTSEPSNYDFSTNHHNNVLFNVENLSFGYNSSRKILDNFTTQFNEGEFAVIIGPNGCGKSTLIKSLVRVNIPDAGHIFFKDKLIYAPNPIEAVLLQLKYGLFKLWKKDVSQELSSLQWFKANKSKYKVYGSKKLGAEISYVPQISNFPESTTIYEFVKMGRFPHSNALGINTNKKKEKEIIDGVLKQVGIYEFRNEDINGVSGGQRQKALIAMSLAQQTDTIILDEPTNHLDIKAQLEIMSLLHRLHHELHKSIILVIHDINVGIKYASTLFIMKDGKLLAKGKPKDIINSEILLEAFGINAVVKTEDGGEIKITEFSLPLSEETVLEQQAQDSWNQHLEHHQELDSHSNK
ncbi:ABC transporter ATP-binding protein [Ureaplasma ceti]|uniref:ABC transporter ATP-binding protein n=1 Tax=Ureaplasma ceti TaxID=3119530 RepID=A0ABP9U9G8_9BACT